MATEKRLIDASHDNAKAILEKVPYYPDEIWKFAAMAKRFPIVDAVEVVRCEDCKWCLYSKVHDVKWCYHESGLCDAIVGNEYCSHGERRTDNG